MSDPLTILVVDDSATMRTILGVILEAAGHEGVFADSVDAAMDLWKSCRPDVVLTDYAMPGRTGRDLVLSLRAAGFDDPIFVISGEKDPTLPAAMARAGADDWFSKPVCVATLLGVLGAINPGRAQARQEARITLPSSFARAG
ncbi:response regulator [Brevundimonas vesicularis]|uniref:response regulator n=1 Tax=Brevundimonas vesicularis TaxID=41276 RepID=UPI0038D3D3B0